MFDADVTLDPQAQRRLAASTTVSLALYGAIAVALFVASQTVPSDLIEKTVDVVFKATVEPPPPTPPPARVTPSKPRPGPVTPQTAAVTPVFKESSEAPKEAEPAAAPTPQTAVEPQVAGGSSGVGPGGGAGGREPINLPENATPPKANDGNAPPGYPESARSDGKEGLVILKIVVDSDGSVASVTVMKGEEPFTSAAIAAVKTWTYSPALVAGVATPVFRIVKVPFRLRS